MERCVVCSHLVTMKEYPEDKGNTQTREQNRDNHQNQSSDLTIRKIQTSRSFHLYESMFHTWLVFSVICHLKFIFMSTTLIININILPDKSSSRQFLSLPGKFSWLLNALSPFFFELLQSQESKSFTLSLHSSPSSASSPPLSSSHLTPQPLWHLCCFTSFSISSCYSTDRCTMKHSVFVTLNGDCQYFTLFPQDG